MKCIINKWVLSSSLLAILVIGIALSCSKKTDEKGAPYNINNSLTLFKIDNVGNNKDLQPADTLLSMSGVKGKYLPVSGNTGSVNGLGKIIFQLLTNKDSLLSSKEITSFFRPEYHVFNTQLDIPRAARGLVYKVVVTSFDKNNTEIGRKVFYGMDVLTCDPLPACVADNQLTIMLETPAGTPDEPIYIFGSINGWSARDDPAFMFHKNPDMANCYCLSIPYPPGYTDWQLTQIFVTRGTWATQAVTAAGAEVSWDYTTTERGPIWKIKVDKWRDK